MSKADIDANVEIVGIHRKYVETYYAMKELYKKRMESSDTLERRDISLEIIKLRQELNAIGAKNGRNDKGDEGGSDKSSQGN